MGKSNNKCLLNIELFEFTGNEIGELKKEEFIGRRRYSSDLPEYCVHSETGVIRTTEDYLQWINTGEEKFLLFNACTIDSLLHEEISNSGLEELLKGIDLRPYLDLLYKASYKNLIHRSLKEGEYLIISLHYISGDMYDPDWNLDVDVSGVLVNLNVINPIITKP